MAGFFGNAGCQARHRGEDVTSFVRLKLLNVRSCTRKRRNYG